MTFLTMNDNQKFIPLSLPKKLTDSNTFVPLSKIHPTNQFEPWTKENWEEMKNKNSEKNVDSFKSAW